MTVSSMARQGWVEHAHCIDDSCVQGSCILADCVVTPAFTRYISSFYYSFTILTTVGFGDISAHRPSERMVCVGVMLAGSYIFALVMGTIASIIMGGNEAKARFTAKVQGTSQHGLSSKKIDLITSDCGATRSLSINWP